MSDITLTAIISVSGALLASIITAVLTYFITKRQVKSRNEEHYRQLDHERLERRRDRLSLAREDYLKSLRKTLNEYMLYYGAVSARITEFVQLKERGENIGGRWGEFDTLANKTKELTENLTVLRGQLSDTKLYDMVIEFEESVHAISQQMALYTRKLVNGKNTDVDILEEVFKESNKIRETLHRRTIPINKRIEELLIGDEAV